MPSSNEKPYRIGVALSGGGARGFAHVGALKAIEEAGLKPDVIAGVSAGSVIAVMYAAGVPFDKMLQCFDDVNFRDFTELRFKGGGLFKLDKFSKHILKIIGPQFTNLEDLLIPTYVGATDIDNAIAVSFNRGSIAKTVTASCSIPILFQPVKIDGVRYVDGGVLRNLPAWVLRDKCDLLIGVNCSPLPDSRKMKDSVFDIGMRSYQIILKANQSEDIKLCDIGIQLTEIAGYNVFNLKEIQQVFIRGYASTKQILKSRPETDRFSRLQ